MKKTQKKRVWVLTKNNEIWETYTHPTKKEVIQDVQSHLGPFFYNSWQWKMTGFEIKMAHIIIESKVAKK